MPFSGTPQNPSQDRPPPARASRSEARGRGSRVFLVSFLVSAVLHLVILVVYPLLVDPSISDQRIPSRLAPDVSTDGVQILSLLEIPDAPGEPDEPDAASDEEPVRPSLPDRAPPTPARTPPGVTEDADTEEERALTAAEQFRLPVGDYRLLREIDREQTQITDEERARLRVYGLLQEWSDSIAALEESERRSTDWTYTDERGRRWGISPGRIHLGEFSLPLPIHFSTPPGLRDEVERRQWEWAEIERGAASAAVREALKERGQEIRRRREAERGDTLRTGG